MVSITRITVGMNPCERFFQLLHHAFNRSYSRLSVQGGNGTNSEELLGAARVPSLIGRFRTKPASQCESSFLPTTPSNVSGVEVALLETRRVSKRQR